MRYKSNTSFILTFLAFLSLISCVKDNEELSVENQHLLFRLQMHEMEGAETRGTETTTIGRITYYLADMQGNILKTPHTSIAPDLSYIRIEGLKKGDYRLLVLAQSDDQDIESVTVSPLASTADEWLRFNEETLSSMSKEYYYADHHFSVEQGVISDSNVKLKHVFGKVRLKIKTNSDFASQAIRRIEVIPDVNFPVCSSMNGNGEYSVEKPLGQVKLTSTYEFPSMPSPPNGNKLKGRIAIYALTSEGSESVSFYNFETKVVANCISTINIDYKHPDDNNLLLYVPNSRYDASNNSRILQDDEPKSIYYNNAKRSFKTKSPLQCGFDSDNKFYIRFYSAVGISNVKLMWHHDSGEMLEFAHFDTIPPFFEAHIEHPITRKDGLLKSEDGRMLSYEAIPDIKNTTMNFVVDCPDPYWKKIENIKTDFNVGFASYGGDPDAPDGAHNGNWMGIRPVHIREACAILTNLSFIISSPDFEEMMMKHDGEFYGNNGPKDIVSSSILVNQYRKDRTLIAGLIWTGESVVGLGGGTVWGVSQWYYFNHYTATEIIWHEFSHCVGYGHSSSMTYGTFAAQYAQDLYRKMAQEGRLPVSYSSFLNSKNNPNQYR